MKKKVIGLLVIFGVLITSCNNNNNVTPVNGVLNCNMDGNLWTSTTAAAVIGNGVINVTGQITSTGETITLVLQGETATTYSLVVQGTNVGAFVPDQSGSASYTSNYTGGSGSVEVTSIDAVNETISGTFIFTGVRAVDGSIVEITEGNFTNIPYVAPEDIQATFNNTFTADVDGVAFAPSLIMGSKSNGMINVTASENGSFPSIGLIFPDNVTVGLYTPSSFGSYRGIYNTANDFDSMYSATSGSIAVTNHNVSDRVIEGTFAFTVNPNLGSAAQNSYDLSNGTFSIEY